MSDEAWCQSDDNCNNKGFCLDENTCVCDSGWFGEHCTNNLKMDWPGGFYAYRASFLIFYSLLLAFVLWKLNRKLRKESRNFGKKKRYIFFLNMWSPLNIIMRVIILICVTQIIWLAVDPFHYENVFTPSLERFLFEISYALMSILYAIVLWVWYTIYVELTIRNPKQKKYQFKGLKPFILIGLLFIVGAQVFVSVTKGFRNDNFRITNLILTVLMFIINISFIVGLTLYGTLLYKCIKAQEKAFMVLTPNPDKSSNAGVAPNLNQLRMNQDRNYSSSSSKSDLSNAVAVKKKKAKSHLDVQSPARDQDLSDEDIPPIEQPGLHKLQSCPVQYKHLRSRKISHPVILEESLQAEMDQKIHELEEENQRGVIFKDQKEILETEKQIRKIEKVRQDLEFKEPILREPRLTRAATVYTSGTDLLKEKKIRDIVQRDQFYFRPIEKKKSSLDLDTEASVIINESEEVVWDVPDEEEEQERQIQTSITEEEAKQNLRKSVEKIKRKTEYQNFMSHESRSLSELYIKRLLKDPEYIRHHQEVIKADEAVIKRIIGQTVAAIILGIISALLDLIVYLTTILSTSLGVLFFIWISGLLTISSIIAILTLFTLVKSQEKENLRLISRIGKTKSRISGFYAFVLPDYLRQDEGKRNLERYINYVTTSNPDFLPAE